MRDSGRKEYKNVRQQTRYILAFIVAAIVGLIAVTGQSLWIDEGSAAMKAMQPTIATWWNALGTEGNSNLQLIFQLFYLWGWEKIFGSSEYALRASNIPWFAVGTVAMMAIFPKKARLQLSVLLLTLTSAFFWYYLSEARPYIVLFAFSAITLACLSRVILQEPVIISPLCFRFFCIGIVGSCASSIIAVPWSLGAILAIVISLGLDGTGHLIRRFRYSALCTAIVMVALAIYYLWTMRIGARASAIGRTSLANIVFALYEFSGIAGLGPGRLALRAHQFAACKPFLPILAPGVALTIILGVTSLCTTRLTRRKALLFGVAVGIPFCVVAFAGYFGHMRLLGRHFTPFLPFILAFFAIGLNRLLFSGIPARITAAMILLLYLTSALQIRLAPRHQRDDYRDAAAAAKEAMSAGKTVWWAADTQTAFYYGLSPKLTGLTLLPDTPLALPVPNLVFLSKPDIYDADGRIADYLRRHNFTLERELPAFRIFQRRSAPPGKE